MSQENVEVVRALFRAWNAGDMGAFRELYDPDGEFEQLRQTWDADAAEPIGDFIDVGDRVAVRHIGRGVGRGPEAEVELTAVWTVREGRILAANYFHDYAEALETLGREQAMSQENLEVGRDMVEAVNRRDIDAF
jgi:ketosteroid isomerase-like protein